MRTVATATTCKTRSLFGAPRAEAQAQTEGPQESRADGHTQHRRGNQNPQEQHMHTAAPELTAYLR